MYCRGFTDIKVADISDIIAGRHEDDALLVLNIICSAIVQNNKEGVLEEVGYCCQSYSLYFEIIHNY